jgi:hypothetical protein
MYEQVSKSATRTAAHCHMLKLMKGLAIEFTMELIYQYATLKRSDPEGTHHRADIADMHPIFVYPVLLVSLHLGVVF